METITIILSIIGALAWLPDIIKLIRNIIKKPKVTIISDKNLELGFTLFGPIINLGLAFSSERKDALITKIILKLEHENKDKYEFIWEWFEENLLEMQIPNAGIVPYKKNQQAIALKVLKDNLVEKKVGFQIQEFKIEKNKQLSNLYEINENNLKNNIPPKSILSTNEYINLNNLYKNSFIWKSGKYIAQIEIFTNENKKSFTHSLNYKISTYDIKQLEKNKDLINKVLENMFIKQDIEYTEIWTWIYPLKSEN